MPKEVLSVGPDYILLKRKNKSLINLLEWNLIHFCHRKLIIVSIVESMLTIKDTSYIVVYKWKNGKACVLESKLSGVFSIGPFRKRSQYSRSTLIGPDYVSKH